MNKDTYYYLCLYLGFLGIHKFYERKIGVGILYLFTCGLFFIGWFYDIYIMLSKRKNISEQITEYEPYEYEIINLEEKEVERIYKKNECEYVYLKPYKDNTAIKVISEKEKVIGDIPPSLINEVFNKKIKTSHILINHELNNDGIMEYKAYIYGETQKINGGS